MTTFKRATMALALIATLAFAQDKTLLRRQLAPGSEVYDVTLATQNSFESPVGTQEMKATGTMTYEVKVVKVDGESAEVEFITKDMKIDAGEAAYASLPDMPKEVKQAGKMDTRNRVKLEASKNALGAAFGMGQTGMSAPYFYCELPEHAVAVGDTWDVLVPGSPAGTGPKEAILKATLLSDKDGKLVVKTVGDIPLEVDTSKMPEGSQRPQMDVYVKGVIKVVVESTLDRLTGKVTEAKTEYKIKSTIEVSGMSLEGTSTAATAYKLKV